jgi:outer membrane protein OmpA-like peptidoglycan-associated protein
MRRLFSICLLLSSASFGFAQNTFSSAEVYFPFNSSLPESTSLQTLKQRLSSSLVDTLFISAHCDAIGSIQYNDSLAITRQKAIEKWLIENKLVNAQKVKIVANAFGKRKPINANLSEEERRLNRRVDVRWTFPLIPIVQPIKETPPVVEVEPIKEKPIDGIVAPTPINGEGKKLEEQIQLAKETGQSLVLKNINFVGGRDEFLREAFPTLKELLKIMKEQTDLKIEIQGHVCCTYNGQDGPNLATGSEHLSVDRAKAVYDYLVYNGIDASRMRYKGLGGSKRLVDPEMSESDRTRNRRVEIVILKD